MDGAMFKVIVVFIWTKCYNGGNVKKIDGGVL